METAFLFPGQGSQRVGMGLDFYQAYPAARRRFDDADEQLGWPLSRLCFEGPEEELGRTRNTQPALYVASLAACAALRQEGFEADAVAGHSLGEYSALTAAGALSFADGLELVRVRGELMEAIGQETPGGMAAILGLESQRVAALCEEAAPVGFAAVANYNAPDQTVISGTTAGVERVEQLARLAGAARVVRLNVSAPFHCRLMAAAQGQMTAALAAVTLRSPSVPVIANVTARPVATPDEIRDALLGQLAGSVRWSETLVYLAGSGIRQFLEVGPGRILTGLTGKMIPGAAAFPAGDARRIADLKAQREGS